MEILSLMIQKNLMISKSLMVQIVFLNESMDFNDPQVLDDPKGIPIGRVDFNNPKNHVDTSIFDGFVLGVSRLLFMPFLQVVLLLFSLLQVFSFQIFSQPAYHRP